MAGIPLTSGFTMNAQLPVDLRFVATDNTARDAIDSSARFEGLLVYVVATKKMWQLKGGITNADWKEAGGGGSGGIAVISDLGGFDDLEDKFDGMLIYSSSDLRTYQLQGGTDISNLVRLNWNVQTSTVQTKTTPGGALTTFDALTERVLVKSTSGPLVQVLPNGSVDGQILVVQGDDDTNYITLAETTNLSQNGETVAFKKYVNASYMWNSSNSKWIRIAYSGAVGFATSAVQTLTTSGVIALLSEVWQRVKIKSSSGIAAVTLPNGFRDGQIIVIQGDDDDNTCTIANGGNVFQNGDVITFTKYYNVTYCWDNANTKWVQLGGY